MEAPDVDPMADGPPPQAELDELPARHDPVLTRGECGELRVDPVQAVLGAAAEDEVERNVHAAIVPVAALQRTPDLHRFAREIVVSSRRSRPPRPDVRRSAP
jgi:hypothetical protein